MRYYIRYIRSVPVVLGAILIGQSARADGYNPGSDPLVERTINHGEAMTSNSHFSDYSPYRDFTWDQQFSGISFRQVTVVPLPPPALGEDLPVTGGVDLKLSPLADVTREIFYGPYSAYVIQRKLSAKDNERLAAYRTTRQKLLEEIQLKFEELSATTPATRIAALDEFAARQEAFLHAHTAEAESIRSDFARSVPFHGFNLPLRGGRYWDKKAAGEARDLFSAAYYDAGLSTEQRLLLPEIAFDLPGAPSRMTTEDLAGKGDYIYFFPATSRIRLPANLSPDLQEKISAFTRERESLKSDLRFAVLKKGYFFGWQRTKRFIDLAEQQAPRFSALHVLAEQIRVGLAAFRYPDQPGESALPTGLTERVGNFYARKVAVQRELLNRLRSLRAEFPKARFDIGRYGDGLAIVGSGADSNHATGLREFNADLASRYTAFARESKTLRSDIQYYTETAPNRATRTVDQLASDFAKAYRVQENWNRYRNYYRAVLEPGLSPAQRQLLFQAAATELDKAGPAQN